MRVSAAPGGSYGMALRLSGGVGLRASLEGLRHPLPIKVDFSAHSCYRTAWEYLAKPSGGKPLDDVAVWQCGSLDNAGTSSEAEMKLRWKGWDGWGVRRTWKERKVERRTDCPCEGTVPPTPLNN